MNKTYRITLDPEDGSESISFRLTGLGFICEKTEGMSGSRVSIDGDLVVPVCEKPDKIDENSMLGRLVDFSENVHLIPSALKDLWLTPEPVLTDSDIQFIGDVRNNRDKQRSVAEMEKRILEDGARRFLKAAERAAEEDRQ